MATYVIQGARVKLRKSCGTSPDPRDEGATGYLLEDARIGVGAGWDVYDVRLDDGREVSAYGFDLKRITAKASIYPADGSHLRAATDLDRETATSHTAYWDCYGLIPRAKPTL